MKVNMGDRRLKRLDRLGTRAITKTSLTDKPVNRAERRKYEHILKAAGVDKSEIDEEALFAAVRERNGT